MQQTMGRWIRYLAAAVLVLAGTAAMADEFSDTVALFKNSSEAGGYFNRAYGYAVFPTIGEGGFVIAGAHGTGRVFQRGRYVGDTAVTEVSVGPQIGAQAYSMIIFFENKGAFDQFTSGNYEFSADATATAITASASLSAGTQGAQSAAQTTKNDATTGSTYRKGVAVFTIVKGGAMVQAAIAGQKFSYTPKGQANRRRTPAPVS